MAFQDNENRGSLGPIPADANVFETPGVLWERKMCKAVSRRTKLILIAVLAPLIRPRFNFVRTPKTMTVFYLACLAINAAILGSPTMLL